MPLGMEVGLGPGDFVLDGDPTPQKGGGAHLPNFRPISIVAKRLVRKDATWYGCRPKPRGPSSPPQGGGVPNFQPTSIAAKRLHGSRCHLVRR